MPTPEYLAQYGQNRTLATLRLPARAAARIKLQTFVFQIHVCAGASQRTVVKLQRARKYKANKHPVKTMRAREADTMESRVAVSVSQE